MPIGSITRGTTGANRLRRIDRWVAQLPTLRRAIDPLVVDLGFGASAATVLELHDRIARTRPEVAVVGIEIDPARVAAARPSSRPGVEFQVGGFEVPLPGGRRATVIRALNVLRQYDEREVLAHWHRMTGRLDEGGVVVEGTCDELGRIASWVDLSDAGPTTLTISVRLAGLERPSIVAERLPKVLIHRNVGGEQIHELMIDLDRQWAVHSPLAVYSATQRWIATVVSLRDLGWPVRGGRARWRLGEMTIAWDAVAPTGFAW